MSKELQETVKNYFEILNEINVSGKIEKKNGLSYLSWAWAWAEIKKRYPNVKKSVVKNKEGWLYHTDGKTCWVEVSVSINDIEEVEYLPIMDFRNQAIKLEQITSMNVNTTIQRALTKAIARHGLGLYIYAGEDLPEGEPSQGSEGNDRPDKKQLQALADGIQEDYKANNEENFKRLKIAIEGTGSKAELEALISSNKQILNGLHKYAPDLFKLLQESKEEMLKSFGNE